MTQEEVTYKVIEHLQSIPNVVQKARHEIFAFVSDESENKHLSAWLSHADLLECFSNAIDSDTLKKELHLLAEDNDSIIKIFVLMTSDSCRKVKILQVRKMWSDVACKTILHRTVLPDTQLYSKA